MPCYAVAGKRRGQKEGARVSGRCNPTELYRGFSHQRYQVLSLFVFVDNVCMCVCVCFLGSRSSGSGEEGGGEYDLCVEDCLGILTHMQSTWVLEQLSATFMQANSRHVMNTPCCFFASIIRGHL
jgi:hypothetical protein